MRALIKERICKNFCLIKMSSAHIETPYALSHRNTISSYSISKNDNHIRAFQSRKSKKEDFMEKRGFRQVFNFHTDSNERSTIRPQIRTPQY